MAKKKVKTKINFIYLMITLIAGALSFVSLAFNFIGNHASGGVLGNTATKTGTMNLGEWFDFTSKFGELNGIASWQVANIFLIITLVLIGLVIIGILVNLFFKNKIFSNVLKIVSILAGATAIVFFITIITGSSALSSSAGDMGVIGVSSKYYPSVAPYLITLFTLCTVVFSFLTLRKSK